MGCKSKVNFGHFKTKRNTALCTFNDEFKQDNH